VTDPERAVAAGLTVRSAAESDTVGLGRAIGASLDVGDAVLLTGELGAGKTVLVRGMAEGVGSPEPARSPTFVLLLEYPGRLTLYHCDLYRIGAAAGAGDIGLDDCLETGALAVEWPENARDALPGDALQITFEVDPETETRTISLGAGGTASFSLLERVSAVLEVGADSREDSL